MRREVCESRSEWESGSERHTHVTHQELPQVFVVGDDAIVDDDELWRQSKGPAQPRHQPPAWQRAAAAT